MKLFLATIMCCTLLVAAGHAQDEKEPAKKEPAKKEPAKEEPVKKEPAKKEPAKEDDGGLKTLSDKVSYGVGTIFGRQLSERGFDADDLNLQMVAEAMRDALAKKKPRNTDAQFQAAFAEFFTAKTKQEGAAFLAANGKKPGVTTTKSGLQYKIIKAGTGKIPKATDRVKVHYRGTLIDGTEFDSSDKQDEPAVFGVTGVIKGWIEALQLMKVGAKWQLVIPSELAYGAKPEPGGKIAPHAVLIFDIELVGIE